jgi:hypothetical protein
MQVGLVETLLISMDVLTLTLLTITPPNVAHESMHKGPVARIIQWQLPNTGLSPSDVSFVGKSLSLLFSHGMINIRLRIGELSSVIFQNYFYL